MSHRIIVLGAGYSGATVAGRLARKLRHDDVTVTLVNGEPDFVERIRLHQLATGQQLPLRPLAAMFADTGVEVRHARVSSVDVDTRTVVLTGDGAAGSGPADAAPAATLEYDVLVHALGSVWRADQLPGAAEHAHQVASRAGALRLHDQLSRLEPGQPVTVVGGGLTGLETATEIAEARPDLAVTLVVAGALGDWLSRSGRRHLRTVLDRLGVRTLEHHIVTRVGANEISFADGTVRPSALTVCTTGFRAPGLAGTTSLALADTGQIVVDTTMRSISHPSVYAVGDAALAPGPGGRPLRMSCASGIPTAWQAADAIAARMRGRRVPMFPIRYAAQCISLGRRDGLVQFVTADDRALPMTLTGGFAARLKELICTGAAWAVRHPTIAPESFVRGR